MGDYAAMAFHGANRSWLSSPEDAHDALYGEVRKRFACPLCGRKWPQARSVVQHLESELHRANPQKAAKADAALEAFRADLIA